MNSSAQNPKLPTWLFIVADVALIAAAAFIAKQSATPLSNLAVLAIVGCVGLGAIVGLVPLVLRFEQQKNEALDERQRELEALARTVSSSAEQISIAANGLHEIVEIAQKNLRHAEQLPHKLQEKIAEFKAQLSAAEDAEKEELERELLALRTTESERLESVSQRIAKSAADWIKLTEATHQHLTSANEAVSKLSFGTASAIGNAQVAAEQALAQARIEAARLLGETAGQGTHAIEAARTQALMELEQRFAEATVGAVNRIASELTSRVDAALARLDAPRVALSAVSQSPVSPPARPSIEDTAIPPASSAPVPLRESPEAPAVAGETSAPIPTPETLPIPAPKPRKPRREPVVFSPPPAEPPPPEAPPPEPAASAPESSTSAPEPAAPPPGPSAPASEPAVSAEAKVVHDPGADEPAPIPVALIPEVVPVAPHTAEPFTENSPGQNSNGSSIHTAQINEAPNVEAPIEDPKPARKRSLRKPEPISEPSLGLDLDEPVVSQSAGPPESVMTSDGATRLVVTAYIGIGNRIFIRGEGPGLSWEKGVPLQFISIGKWRWETNDATVPLQYKIYKNDDLECAALGVQTLDPGRQQEVRAPF